MTLDFGTQPRVWMWMSIAAALMLHGCNDNEQNTAADAKLTVSIPQASTRSQRAARTAVPEYVQAITVTVLDAAERPIASGEIPATGGTLALTVPPNLALHVTGAALDKNGNTRFSGSQEVPPIAAGTTASVSLTLEALTPLSTPVQSAEQGPLTVVENTKNIAMITTNAKPDQHVNFSITGGADRKYFSIDASSGQLSFAANPLPTFANPQDADHDNVYEVQVTFTDNFETVAQDLKIKVVVQPGSLDTRFGANHNGIVTQDFSLPPPALASFDIAKAVVVQSDGKIVVAGTTATGSALVRYTRDGILDESFGRFGAHGIVRLSGTVNAMALQSNDDIIVAGSATNTAGNTDFLLESFEKNGQVDSASNWRVMTDIANGSNDRATALVIQADGSIVVAGDTDYNIPIPLLVAIPVGTNFAVARYKSTGGLDPNFGPNNTNNNGIVITPITGSTNSHANAVTLQGDTLASSGKIVVAGHGNFVTTGEDFVVVRYDNSGNRDNSFNSTPTDFGSSNDHATGVVIQPDRKIVVVGGSGFHDLAIARYEENGSLDSTFGIVGRGGKVTRAEIDANAVVLQPDGKIAIAGSYDDCSDLCLNFFVARYNNDGSDDTAFGVKGRVVNSGLRTAFALALQTDGKIVVAGKDYGDFAVVRYTP